MKKTLLLFALIFSFVVAKADDYMRYAYRGTLANSTIEVCLNMGKVGFDYLWAGDSYARYPNTGGGRLTLKPKSNINSKTWVFYEYNSKGKKTGTWTVKQTNSGLTGSFTNAKTGKKYKVQLYETNGDNWDWGW